MDNRNELTCPDCYTVVVWDGKVADVPPCPKCGNVFRLTVDHEQELADVLAASVLFDAVADHLCEGRPAEAVAMMGEAEPEVRAKVWEELNGAERRVLEEFGHTV